MKNRYHCQSSKRVDKRHDNEPERAEPNNTNKTTHVVAGVFNPPRSCWFQQPNKQDHRQFLASPENEWPRWAIRSVAWDATIPESEPMSPGCPLQLSFSYQNPLNGLMETARRTESVSDRNGNSCPFSFEIPRS